MNIYDALKRDHDELKPLLDRLVAATRNDDDTKQLLDQIRDMLVPHSRAEEAVLYNSLRQLDAAKDVVTHSYAEHAKAETLLRTMKGMAVVNIEWTKMAEKLRDDLNHHISEEETRVFNVARQVLLDEEARQMGDAFERMKPQFLEQSAAKNMMDLVANIMPARFADKFRSAGPEIPS